MGLPKSRLKFWEDLSEIAAEVNLDKKDLESSIFVRFLL